MEILCVDDEEGILDLTKLLLEGINPNFIITPCTSAREGLQLLQNRTFDVIVSDYQMPELDGIEFLKKIRSEGNNIPFIIFTGRGKEEVAVEALNSGANRYIQKEGAPKALYEVLSKAIQAEYDLWTAQRELVISEKRFRTLLDTLAVGIATTDKNRVITYVNNKLSSMLGYSLDEMVSRESIDFFNDENKKIIENYREAGRGREDPYEIEWTTKAGKQVLTQITPFRILDDNKEIDSTVGIIVDIRAAKRKEKEINDSLIELEQIFQMVNTGMILINKDFSVNKVNKSFVRLSGISETMFSEKICKEHLKLSVCNTSECTLTQILNGAKEAVLIDEVEFSSGKKVKCKITARPLLDSEGKFKEIVERFDIIAD